ncbi:hypothetical protein SAMN05216368_11261 [Cryobacterium flavum]|uniref:Alkaline shock response membrane anchor protein AmaP n=1 Tax=Cryobacterium flavum TaxID=1424659 RepID=A0A4R8UWV0_9MICO|nr:MULTISPECIES: DUF6286 domain-containing protein [Cryobacterium]TFB72002.1 hypothetical protein E3O21_19385 [Cryobacterium flavum]SDO20465.1 hypothetical protein SAMN05216368_11261 [Cryobacterium flavum]
MSASTSATYGRIRRRELHSPRAAAAISAAIVVILLCAWLGTEIVLRLTDQPALLTAPADLADGVASASSAPLPLLIGTAVGCALVGLVLLVLALSPGRRARHVMVSERAVTIVDDEVIASALAGRAARTGGIDPDNTRVNISRRLATVHLVPASGQAVHRDTVLTAVRDQLDGLQLRPALQTRVVVAVGGKVGA